MNKENKLVEITSIFKYTIQRNGVLKTIIDQSERKVVYGQQKRKKGDKRLRAGTS